VVTNLTRTEAEARAAVVTNVRCAVDLDLSRPADDAFRSTTRLTFDAVEGAATWVDVEGVRIVSAALDGRELDLGADGLLTPGRLHLTGLRLENALEVVAEMPYASSGEGLHRFVDPEDGETYLYTFTAPAFARQVFACFDQPDLKAEFAVSVTAPEAWTVLSNGLPAGPPRAVHDGVVVHRFAPTPPIASYLLAVAAGPWRSWGGTTTLRDGRVLPTAWHARASLAAHVAPDVDGLSDLTRRGLDAYELLFGHPFSFDSYDQVFVPEHVVGAMENPGLVTFSERMVHREAPTDAELRRRELTVLHEMAHQWFGDLVTMRWWDDLWLNESFADFVSAHVQAGLAAEAGEDHDPWTEFAVGRKGWAYAQDLLPTTHPVVGEVPDLESLTGSFDGITYGKGAAALRQLAAVVGPDAFFAGVSQHLRDHAFGSATLADLVAALSASSGRDLDPWARSWLRTSGVNEVRASLTADEHGAPAVEVVQRPDAADGVLRPRRLEVAVLAVDDGGVHRRSVVEVGLDGPRVVVPLDHDPGAAPFVLANAGDLDYAVVDLDGPSTALVRAFLRGSDHGLDRAVVHASTWRAVTAARLPATRWVDLVLDGLPAEVDSSTLRTVLGQLGVALTDFVPEDRAVALAARVGTRLWQQAQEAAPASDQQRQLVRALADTARAPEQAGLLRGLREGDVRLDGLEVGQDTSWRLLTALVRCGAASGGEVERAEAADRGDAGRRWAALARAALPGEASKRRAWRRVLRDESLAPELVQAVGTGWRSTATAEDLAGHADEYVAALDDAWSRRGTRAAQDLTASFAPPPALGDEGVRALRTWLAAHPGPTGARRAVREALAGLEQALAARQVVVDRG